MNLKNVFVKITAIFAVIAMMAGNFSLLGTGINAVIAEELKTPEIQADIELSKYVQYDTNGAKGVIVKAKISEGDSQDKETYKPVQNKTITVQASKINGEMPERVKVIANSTKAINGKDGAEVEFSNDNWNYDKNSGLLTISLENNSNYSTYVENAKDEFEIIYIYGANSYKGNEEEVAISLKANIVENIKADNETIKSEKNINKDATVKENIGDITSIDSIYNTDIYKGYMYSNNNNKTSYETEYTTTSNLEVLNSDLIDNVIATIKQDDFVVSTKKEDKTISTNGNIYYKSTTMSKKEFDNILGTDGAIELSDGTERIATIKYSEPDKKKNRKLQVEYNTGDIKEIEDNNITVEYSKQIDSIIIKTSKPITEGTLQISNRKAIKAFSQENLENVKSIQENSEVQSIKNVTEEQNTKQVIINSYKSNKNIELKEPEEKISVELSSSNLSTLSTNKVRLTMKMDDTNSSCKLAKAGNMELTLPQNLTSAKIITTGILYGNGIEIKSAKIENGKLIISLVGEEKSYNIENINGGINIVTDLELDINDTVATHNETLNLSYNSASVTKDVNIISNAGLLVLNDTSTNNGKSVRVIGNTSDSIELAMNKKGQTVSQEIKLVNNYDKDITDLEITGLLGYKDKETAIDFTFGLLDNIVTTDKNIKVYYSKIYEQGEWTEGYTSDAKAYKIIIKNLKAKSSESLKIKLSVPNDMDYNKKSYLSTNIQYTYDSNRMNQESIIKFETEANNNSNINENQSTDKGNVINQNDNIKVSTEIKAGNQKINEGETVREGQILKYKITATNESDEAINNLKFQSQINNAVYYEIRNTGIIYTIDENGIEKYSTAYSTAENGDNIRTTQEFSLSKGESKTYEYQVMVLENIENIKSNIKLLKENQELLNKDITNNVEKAKIKTQLRYSFNEESKVYSKTEMNITLKITAYENVNNLKTIIDLPEELSIKTYELYNSNGTGINVEENDNKDIEVTIDNLEENKEFEIVFICKTAGIDNKLKSKNIEISSTTVINNKEKEVYNSNNLEKTIYQSEANTKFSVTKNFGDSDVFKENREIEYMVTLQNNGVIDFNKFNLSITLDDGLKIKKMYIDEAEQDITKEDNKSSVSNTIQLLAGKTVTVKYVIDLNLEDTEKDDKLRVQIEGTTGYTENYSHTSYVNINKKSNNNQDNTDTPDNPDDPEKPDTPDNPNNPSEETKHTISGVAWLDNNKNGQRDEGETLLKDIKVYLYDSAKGEIVKDSEGNAKTATTDENGTYRFEGLEKGSYIVIFEFDTSKYTVTTYQKEGTTNSINSDAILSNVTINGTSKKAGITDKIEISNENIENIDIGLIENATFDLSLDKQISSIQVINKQGTKTTEYNNKNFAKIDLVAKYMNNTNVIINYKFVIKNNGDVTGYVDKLVDNLPSGLEFSSEINKDWYKGSDGNLYTTSLNGIAIKPGETSEVELILTKKTTENTTGTFSNNAELSQISNIEAIEEKAEAKENNKSSADLVISIKTGSVIMYIGITIGCIAIIAAGAYIIKKKVINKEI